MILSPVSFRLVPSCARDRIAKPAESDSRANRERLAETMAADQILMVRPGGQHTLPLARTW